MKRVVGSVLHYYQTRLWSPPIELLALISEPNQSEPGCRVPHREKKAIAKRSHLKRMGRAFQTGPGLPSHLRVCCSDSGGYEE